MTLDLSEYDGVTTVEREKPEDLDDTATHQYFETAQELEFEIGFFADFPFKITTNLFLAVEIDREKKFDSMTMQMYAMQNGFEPDEDETEDEFYARISDIMREEMGERDLLSAIFIANPETGQFDGNLAEIDGVADMQKAFEQFDERADIERGTYDFEEDEEDEVEEVESQNDSHTESVSENREVVDAEEPLGISG